ncbi:MAG: hypothetical protein SH847_06005 [Roseiflexaceae bacterium]|nr:hypothetical protein [Roseiflexaceae bacterium]
MKDAEPHPSVAVTTSPRHVVPITTAATETQRDPASALHQVAALPTTHSPNPAHVQALQRTVGNHAVTQLLARRTNQKQHSTDASHDAPEQGASGLRDTRLLQKMPNCDQAVGALSAGNRSAIQRLVPHELFVNDRPAFDRLIQNLRDNADQMDWDWPHVEERHVLDDGMEEGEVRDDLDADDCFFEATTRAAIFDLMTEAITNGARSWEEERSVVWFTYDFGEHIGGYPDGTSATRVRVFIDTDAMDNEGDIENAHITTVFPLA